MILFSKIRWKNILSTGDVWTEVNFQKSRSTLIVGENGAGKSTILDAICFALFAKPFRKINKSQLINSINKKGMLVEIEFSIGSKQYLIRRGQKPNVFDIIVDGNMLNQTSDVREYQEMLEKNILKLNFKSFSQIVMLGSASFTPFMQLPAAHRREIIEDLLDIQIFSTMNSILKEKVQLNKEEITSVNYELKLLAEKIELQKRLAESMLQNNEAVIAEKTTQATEVGGNLQIALDALKELNDNILSIEGTIIDSDQVQAKLKKIERLYDLAEAKEKKIESEIEFFNNNDDCPTCRQAIEQVFKYKSIEEKMDALNQLVTMRNDLVNQQQVVGSRIDEIDAVNDQLSEKRVTALSYRTQIQIYENTLSLIKTEIEQLKQKGTTIGVDSEEMDALKRSLKSNVNTKEELLKDKAVLDVAAVLLKDSGVKTKIIKQYIPVINKLVNKYLAAMDFFVNFDLNENFEETIRSRHRDDFSYESFSEGEKMRIDLALLFTWRSISKLRNSASTNLLIMDEVFDSSLDNSGTEEFLKIINTLTADTNLFIISHKGDQLFDKFHSVIKFQKVKNFSQMVK
jgi:DNA repair exonuclease SbcCD ATPase subunit